MRRLLLTSTGLHNKAFAEFFLEQIGKNVNEIRVIFVPTAAIFDAAREMLPACFHDLTDLGILPEHILIYHLELLLPDTYSSSYMAKRNDVAPMFRLLSEMEMKEFDAIYFCGGNPAHLLNEINRTGFANILKLAVENGLFYIGVSAGSIIAAGNLPNNLGYMGNELSVHCGSGSPNGKVSNSDKISLSDLQGIWIHGKDSQIID
ncbi:MAG: Type 1 glutamine amidotransferase-like domain-containing protein [Victivallaceae bacterium]